MTTFLYSFSTKHRRAEEATPPSNFGKYLHFKWGCLSLRGWVVRVSSISRPDGKNVCDDGKQCVWHCVCTSSSKVLTTRGVTSYYLSVQGKKLGWRFYPCKVTGWMQVTAEPSSLSCFPFMSRHRKLNRQLAVQFGGREYQIGAENQQKQDLNFSSTIF